MAQLKKTPLTLNSLFFSTTEQRIVRLLLTNPTTSLTPRVIVSHLKGLRGLGGSDGVIKILESLQEIGLVDFVDNRRAVRLQDDNSTARILKVFLAICDLEELKTRLAPISRKGILFGSRALGTYRSDSDYDLFVISESPEEVKKISSGHPLGKAIELIVATPERYEELTKKDKQFSNKLAQGIVLW